jgi:hypothetical protein
MSPRAETRYIIKGTTVKNYNKTELMKELVNSGFQPRRGYNKKELDDIVQSRGVPLQRQVNIVEEGWVGKQKGALQVAYERGFIDTTLPLSSYSLDGKDSWKDENGDILESYRPFCLCQFLSECPNFKNEKSALQYLVEAYNSSSASFEVLFSPKYHCEIAGEGIEYSWAFTKQVFQSIPYKKKKTSDLFRKSVRESVEKASISNARNFCGRAHRYMLAYLHYDSKVLTPSFTEIEKYVDQKSKTHRSVLDSEAAYIRVSQAMRTSIHRGRNEAKLFKSHHVLLFPSFFRRSISGGKSYAL